MVRFHVEQKDVFRDRFLISDEAVCNHLRQVLRIGKGKKIELFDGQGNLYVGEIRYLDKKQVSGMVISHEKLIEPYPYVILGQAFPKAGKADEIVRMNTEVGVSEFVFFKSEYSIPQIESYDYKKIDRLNRVVIEAVRQSERVIVPQINPACDFKDILKMKADVKVMLHPRLEGGISISDLKVMINKKNRKADVQKKILVLIGPEGGFSPAEVEKAKESGFVMLKLNMPILRTETAGVVVSGIIIGEA